MEVRFRRNCDFPTGGAKRPPPYLKGLRGLGAQNSGKPAFIILARSLRVGIVVIMVLVLVVIVVVVVIVVWSW